MGDDVHADFDEDVVLEINEFIFVSCLMCFVERVETGIICISYKLTMMENSNKCYFINGNKNLKL